MTFKQADRLSTDGPVSVTRVSEDELRITVSTDETDRHQETIRISPFNAARLFGMMALMLDIPLPKAVAKAIKL